eukprot:gene24664-33135_t
MAENVDPNAFKEVSSSSLPCNQNDVPKFNIDFCEPFPASNNIDMSNALAASPQNSENSISTSSDHHTDEKAKQNTEVDSASLKNSIMLKLLQVLNNGSYEELTKLKGIGKKRALLVLTERNAGAVFRDLSELAAAGILAERSLRNFLLSNVAGVAGF